MIHPTETHSRHSPYSSTLPAVPVVTIDSQIHVDGESTAYQNVSTINDRRTARCAFFVKRDGSRERHNIGGGPGQRYRRVDDVVLGMYKEIAP